MNRLLTLGYGRFSDTSHRLGSMLFVAALLHGVVILGVTFSGVNPLDSADLPVLRVTVLMDTPLPQQPQDESEYLANRDSTGGNAAPEGARPTNAIASEDPLTLDGERLARGLEDRAPREPERPAEQLVSQRESDQQIAAEPRATDDVAARPEQAAALLNLRSAQTQSAELDIEASLPDSANESPNAAPSAVASILAGYLDGWRQRVERIGTLNFPVQYLSGNTATRRPTLLVTIGPDGSLEDAVVQNSSGDSAVDQAALSILRLAEPFEPFPDAVRAEFEVLRFAYDWDFIEGRRALAR